MATVGVADGASPVSSAKLSELGKALGQASISSAGGVASPAATHEAPSSGNEDQDDEADLDDDDDEDEDDEEAVASEQVPRIPAPRLSAKSPKKRGRTDSMKKLLPPPASQRHKQVRDALMDSPRSSMHGSSGTEEDSAASPSLGSHEPPHRQQQQTQPAKLMVKDRKGSGMGVPRAHLILNAVKQAPPAKEKSNPRRWSKHEDESLRLAVERSGERNWKAIADQVPGRNHTQCLQRWTKVLKPGLIKVSIATGNAGRRGHSDDGIEADVYFDCLLQGHWTPEEDAKLRDLDKIIIEMQAKLGNRWSIIAQQLKVRAGGVSSSTTKTELDAVPENNAVLNAAAPSDIGTSIGNMVNPAFMKGSQPMDPPAQPDLTAAAMGGTAAAMQNVSDLVAASIHNFRMSQRFHHSSGPHASNVMYPGTSNQMMNPMPPPSMPPAPTYSSQAMAMAMANAPYQQQQQQSAMPGSHQGFSGVPLHPRGMAMSTPTGTQSAMMANSSSATTMSRNYSNMSNNNGTGGNGGLPPSSAAAAAGGKALNTPREEWGSSQTPRSQMILTEGHASAYELFHQQRLRLMLQEREKQGMSLSSAPSPGQAMLTKELEANKERQARQAIMQKGWKSAVESMISFNSDLSALDDQQRFDGLLEKVSLSALDPTDDELLDQTVDIIGGEETVEL
ncbi:hypothetical protein BBJ28_00001593 [Nothophytophthora sp. Chile5]|nr:hypothetical protein BBJ28_00001593 [Nothophytophthora sp. Chile5]